MKPLTHPEHAPRVCPRRRGRSRAAAALLWGLALFAGIQLALSALMDTSLPQMRDPEYGYKLARLKALCRRHPGRPLVLVLGSSRSQMGVRPDALGGCRAADGKAALVFNFGLTAASPPQELELLCLRRVLACGLRPAWVFIEVLPPFLHQGGDAVFDVNRLSWPDLAVVRPHLARPRALVGAWLLSRLAPCFSHRFSVLSTWGRGWLPPGVVHDWWNIISADGWISYPSAAVDAETYRRGVAVAREAYRGPLTNFRVTAQPDRALRELLGLCRREGIRAALFLMPEGSEFRGWYTPEARAQIDGYLSGLGREFGVPVVDARTWMADGDFFDSHHLLPGGAAAFTRQFGSRALGPLLEGRPCDALLVGR